VNALEHTDPTAQIARTGGWRYVLLYMLTLITVGIALAVAYNITSTNATSRQVQLIVTHNRTFLCDVANIERDTPPETATERKLRDYMDSQRGSLHCP
jgi:hypothetical protein